MSADSDTDDLAELLHAEAAAFVYPPTPDIAAAVGRRLASRPRRDARPRRAIRLALAAALLLAALLAVPDVRAAALRLLQIGVVRVRVEPGPPPTALPVTPIPTAALPASQVPAASSTLDLGLSGETTLAAAARRVEFPIRLPAFPADLGPPDRIFLQDLDGDALIFIWLDPASPGRPLLSLHTLTSRAFVEKMIHGDETERLAEAQVGGEPALWVRGPHLLQVGRQGRADIAPVRVVDGNTLIWTADGLTYRLECDLSLDEALRVAESLQ